MKIIKIALFLAVLLPLPIYAADDIPFTIYHTNDLHSHFDGVKVPSGESYEKRGGYARITTLINQIKKDKKDQITIGVDAGDFYSGTIFSAIALSNEVDFPEYQFFIDNSYDLLTLGNHEFDPQNSGLEFMLKKMDANKDKIPLVASNLYVTSESPLRHYVGEDKLIRPYMVKEFTGKNGKLRVGFLGVLGPDGCLVSRSTRGDVHFVGFDDQKSKQQQDKLAAHLNPLILKMRQKDKVDVVILTIHSGGQESHELAAKLKGLDIMIAGHTHKQEFAIVNGVVVNQTGSYGENLGYLEFKFNAKKKKLQFLNQDQNHVITINDKFEENPLWKKRIEKWKKKSFELIGEKGDPDEIVFTPLKSYIRSSDIPNPMGELVTSALIDELNDNIKKDGNKEGNKEDPVDAYFTSMGLIRTSFYKNTPYTKAEVFEAVSIGYDDNKRPGVDVVTFYLSPKEVKTIINFMEIYTFISTSFSPAVSPSLSFKIRKWGIPFVNRIHDIKLHGKPLSDYERPIKIATNKFVVLNLETVKKITRGWIDLQPKTKSGEALVKFQTYPKEFQLLIKNFQKNPGKY